MLLLFLIDLSLFQILEIIHSSENEFIIEEDLLVQRIEPEPQEEMDLNHNSEENMQIQIDNPPSVYPILDNNEPTQIIEESSENHLVLVCFFSSLFF